MEIETLNPEVSATAANPIDVSASVIEKHRKQRSDAGKPRGPRGQNKPRNLANQVNGNSGQEAPEVPLAPVDIGAVKKGVSSLCKAVDAVLVRKTYRTAMLVTKDEKFSQSIASDVAMQAEENDLISELTAVVCQRHEILGRFAPECLLVLALGSYGTRVLVGFRKLNDIAETMQKVNANKP